MGQGLEKAAGPAEAMKDDVSRKGILLKGMYGSGASLLGASLQIANDEKEGKKTEETKTREELLEMAHLGWSLGGGYIKYRDCQVSSVEIIYGGRMLPTRAMTDRLYKRAAGLVFVIDSSDCIKIEEAKNELDILRKKPELNGAVIIAVANKQDLPDAKTADEVADIINEGSEERIKVLPASAQTGEGVLECFDWLIDEVTSQHKVEAVAEPWVEVVTDVKKDGKAGMKTVKVALKKLVSNFRMVSASAA